MPELPAQDHALGSLAGDPALVDAVAREGYATLLTGSLPALHTLDPDTARVNLVERVGDRVVGVLSARTPGSRYRGFAWVEGPDAAHLRGGPVMGVAGPPEPFPTTVTGEVCGRRYGALLMLPGTTGTLTAIADVTAAGRLVRTSLRVPFRADGSAVVPIPAGRIELRLSGGQSDGPAGDVTDEFTPSRYRPSRAEIARVVAAAPGTADDAQVTEMAWQQYPNEIELPQGDFRIHRKARVGDRVIMLASVGFRSGARYVWAAQLHDNGSWGNGYGGIVPAGALDRTVIAIGIAGSPPGNPLIIHATGGVRAELVRARGVEQVAMQSGSAVIADHMGIRKIRAYDAAGRLLGETAPYAGLTPIDG